MARARSSTRRRWRWLAFLGAGAAALLAVAFGLAVLLVDARQVSDAVAARLSARLGAPVEIGSVGATWLPGPAVHLEGVRLRAAGDEEPFLRADRVHLRISLLALFVGKVALRSVEIEAPHLTLALGDDGTPLWPTLAPRAYGEADGPVFLVTSLEVRDGVAQLGPHRLERLALRGSAHLDRRAELEFEAELAGVGPLRGGRVELAGVGEGPVEWKAELSLEGVELTALRERIAPQATAEIAGTAYASLRGTGRGSSLATGDLEVDLRAFSLRGDAVAVGGDVRLDAQLGGTWRLDLEGTEIAVAERIRKPIGVPAEVSGPLPSDPRELDLRVWDDWELRVGGSTLRGDARLLGSLPILDASGELDLGELAAWSSGLDWPVRGRLQIERLAYVPPSTVSGSGLLDGAVVRFDEARSATLSGPVFVEGARVGSRDLAVGLIDETFHASGSYDLASEEIELKLASTHGFEVAELAELIGRDRRSLTGRAYGSLELRGLPRAEALRGLGEIEVLNGTMWKISLDQLADGVRVRRPTDGPQPFQRLFAAFAIHEGGLDFSEISFEQRDASALLRGSYAPGEEGFDLLGEARYYVGPDFVATPFALRGPLHAIKASLDVDSPEQDAARVESKRKLLQGMLDLMVRRPAPADPEQAREIEERIELIESQLRKMGPSENAESASGWPGRNG